MSGRGYPNWPAWRQIRRIFPIILGITIALSFSEAWAQQEVTSEIFRLGQKDLEKLSYQRYEARPIAHLPLIETSSPRAALLAFSTTAEQVRIRTLLADAHLGLEFYNRKTCVQCHPAQARSMHEVRAQITCRQCHGPDPMAGIRHYYSPLNPIRRYAFVCAKCHEGSSASFAAYVIHPPSPASIGAWRDFPVLAVVFWFMVALAVGTFAVFLPHTLAWGLRELWPRKGQSAHGQGGADED